MAQVFAQQENQINVFKDSKTGDVLIRLFLISNEYINKQDWKVGTQNFDNNVQKSTGHDLVVYPFTMKDGRTILDHPPYNTATASDIEASYKNQQNYSIGKAVMNKKYKPTSYHSIYRITDPDAAKWFVENSDEQGNLKVPIYTSPGILYTDKQKYDWENWIITHNAIVTKPANKEEDAGFFKSCQGDLETTCQHIAASALTPCMLEGSKPAPALTASGKNVVSNLLDSHFKNTSQESKDSQVIIMSNQGSDGSNSGTQDQAANLQALMSSDKTLSLNADQLKQLATDLKVPEQLITSFVDYKTKYNELLQQNKKAAATNPTDDNKDEDNNQKKPIPADDSNNNNKETEEIKAELTKIKRENAIVKMLPTSLYTKQEDYDKDIEKFVNSKYELSDLKEIIGVKIEKANIEKAKAELAEAHKKDSGSNPQPNSAIASLLGGSFNNPGYAEASDSNKDKDINELPHIRLTRSLLLNNTFGDLL